MTEYLFALTWIILFYITSQKKEKSYVPENASRAIKYFQENGGRFTFATGRFPIFIKKNLSEYVKVNAPLVSLNGCMIYDLEKDAELYRCTMKDDVARITYDVIERFPNMLRMNIQCDGPSYNIKHREGGGYIYRNEAKVADKYEEINTREEFSEIFGKAEIFKMLYVFEADESEKMRDEIISMFPEYDVSRSWPNGVEMQNSEAGKGNSTRRLAEMLGDVRLLVCVGDFENDISMIKGADVGFAVENAVESVKAAADRVTSIPCSDGAMEEIISILETEYAYK